LIYECGPKFVPRVKPLGDLATFFTTAPVKVYFFEVKTDATATGVRIEFAGGHELKEPLRKRARAAKETGEDEDDSAVSSDLLSSDAVVGTAGEDTPTSVTSDSGEDTAEPAKFPIHEPATGGKSATETATGVIAAPEHHLPRLHKLPDYDNGYFYIMNNEGQDDVKILIHKVWTKTQPPTGMGGKGMSKTLTPQNYGELRSNPVRSHFLLRAWMLWRARNDGFVAADPRRKLFFDEEALRLELDVRAYQPQEDNLLGNAKASILFIEWVPDIAGRIC
jgi:hypothetical protein